jgi:Flp pilus assembly protein TadG
MWRISSLFRTDERGAVAPTVALSLFALIAVGGIAFDYARMAALDTELQNAADQAALAAATQLDGRGGARDRATAAAQALVANLTYFANDGGGTGITVPTVEFYSTYNPNRANVNDAPGSAATTDDTANYVRVTVGTRTARYALTPIVAAFNSGPMTARALAGIGSAVCNVPPVMICNPFEGSGGAFNGNALRGVGLKLVQQGGSGAWAPGNFGYVDDPNTDNGTPGVRASLGWESVPGNCSPGPGLETETGIATTVTEALNTRFDIQSTQGCPVGGSCRPSRNSVKDLAHPSNFSAPNACREHNQGWRVLDNSESYRPTSTTELTPAQIANIRAMGHPRDICHAIPANNPAFCGQVGNGVWDRNAYFQVNHPGLPWQTAMTSAGLDPNTVTRYQVYRWELDGHMPTTRSVGSNLNTYPAAICTAPGLSPPVDQDRRRISAAVVNCVAEGVRGNSTNIRVESWVDLFLVEPSLARSGNNQPYHTNAGDIYVEVISQTPAPGPGGAVPGQVAARNVPRLLE